MSNRLDSIGNPPEAGWSVHIQPGTVAWLVLLAGFVCFCALSAAAARAVYWFIFESRVPLSVELVVSQGSVVAQPASPNLQVYSVYNSQAIDPQTSLTVSPSSQAVLNILDSYSDLPVASLTLLAGSEITVDTATRPRFEVSRLGYTISLNGFDGQFLLTTSPGKRAFDLEISSAAGTASITDDGQYTIYTDLNPATNDPQLHLFNQGGTAALALPGQQSYAVAPNSIGHIANSSKPVRWDSQSPYTLLVSGLFEGQLVSATNPLPDGWQCIGGADRSNDPNAPLGVWSRVSNWMAGTIQMNGAIHLWRVGQNLGHGESSCFIDPNGPGGWLDTSSYQSLRLHVRFMLLAHDPLTNDLPVQDFPQCGVQGSECPVMLEVEASPNPTDPSQTEKWYHGFYYKPSASLPSICDSCRTAHEKVNPDVWYFYDSGDLLQQLLPTPGTPLYIKRISVYASGHQYDVAIGEVSLLGS